jgi:hypothetical protein
VRQHPGLAAAGFVVQNPQDIEIRYYLGWHWRGPLAWGLLAALVLGALLGLIVALPARFRDRRRALRGEDTLAGLQHELVQRRSASEELVSE